MGHCQLYLALQPQKYSFLTGRYNVCQKSWNYRSPYDTSAAPIIQNLGWSTISNLVRKVTARLTYKSLNSLAPDNLRKLFPICSDDRERFLRSSETDIKIPLLKSINGQKAFSYRCVRQWNF